MEEHCIGTPTLQLRIIEADAPRKRELPLSTLQRFLAGSHRTTDVYVEMCARFLEHVGALAERSDFGAALAAFIGDGETWGDRLAAEYAGDFLVRAGEQYGPPLESFATFSPVPGQPFLAVREKGFNLPGGEGGRRRHPYEGVLVANLPLVHVMLRSTVTRQPKIYYLKPVDQSGKGGLAGEASFIDLENQIRHISVRIGRPSVT